MVVKLENQGLPVVRFDWRKNITTELQEGEFRHILVRFDRG